MQVRHLLRQRLPEHLPGPGPGRPHQPDLRAGGRADTRQRDRKLLHDRGCDHKRQLPARRLSTLGEDSPVARRYVKCPKICNSTSTIQSCNF